MVDLTIPVRFRPGLATLLGLSPQAAKELKGALEKAPPTLSPRGLLDAVAHQVASIPEGDLSNALETLRSLDSLRAQLDLTVDECVRSISQAIDSGDYGDLNFETKSREEFDDALHELLAVDSLAREAKDRPERDNELERTFRRLVDNWRAETRFLSSVQARSTNRWYQMIIGLGEPALPHLLRELERAPDHWFWALRSIAREDPVESYERFSDAVAAWLRWGRDRNLL